MSCRKERNGMAEMTAAQAIKVLHNNQYQKHIGNGEYDYIHPLTDAEAKLIEKLIEQQAQEIERLQIREHRMIEYMRDIKNFAFTINEVANNAIEEAEVRG